MDSHQVSERGQDEVEEKKRMAKDLILGWTHTKVSERGQDRVVERKRMAKELILGWTHTKVCTIGAVDFHRFRIDLLRKLLGNF